MADSLLNVRPQAHRRRIVRARVLGVILHRGPHFRGEPVQLAARPPQKKVFLAARWPNATPVRMVEAKAALLPQQSSVSSKEW